MPIRNESDSTGAIGGRKDNVQEEYPSQVECDIRT